MSVVMAESTDGDTPKPAVHIVYTQKRQDDQHETYHIRTLASDLGSEEAAKEALIYSYRTAATGFSAKLTPEQVVEISKQASVIRVILSQNYELHSGATGLH